MYSGIKQIYHKPVRQTGATLIVVLVILIAMTFLGLGAMSDTNLQLAMVRNSQLQNSAHTVALSETEAQIDVINSNAEGTTDEVIADLVSVDIVDGFRSTSPAKLITDILGYEYEDEMPYETTLTLEEPNAGAIINIPGYSISSDSTVKLLAMQFRSTATVENTNNTSEQVQGFLYLSAN